MVLQSFRDQLVAKIVELWYKTRRDVTRSRDVENKNNNEAGKRFLLQQVVEWLGGILVGAQPSHKMFAFWRYVELPNHHPSALDFKVIRVVHD